MARGNLRAAAVSLALLGAAACAGELEPRPSVPEAPAARHMEEAGTNESAVITTTVVARGTVAAAVRSYTWHAIENREQLDSFIRVSSVGMSDTARGEAYDRLDAGQSLVLVALGERPTGGYWIEPVAAVTTAQGIRITVREQRPAPGAIVTQAITSPWALFALPSGPVIDVRLAD